ncbi:hypothetical protein Tco_0726566 [Tanacetum coccineum]|uniref:Uncharacterized protein n=1 Tax=Tanacetum coccineum TaxID=301880 RepID=A0ABQ4YGV4_9ASTR
MNNLLLMKTRYSIKYVGTDVNRFEVFAVYSGNASQIMDDDIVDKDHTGKECLKGEAENGKKEDELLKVLKQEALQLLKKRLYGELGDLLQYRLHELKADKHEKYRDANLSQVVEALRRLFPGIMDDDIVDKDHTGKECFNGEVENGKKEDEFLKVLKQEALQLLKKRENGNHR